MRILNTLPVRAEALFFIRYKMLLPLQGVNAINPRNPGCRFACPGLGAFGLSARALSAEKTCRKKWRILNTLPNGVRMAHHNTLMILSNIMQKKMRILNTLPIRGEVCA